MNHPPQGLTFLDDAMIQYLGSLHEMFAPYSNANPIDDRHIPHDVCDRLCTKLPVGGRDLDVFRGRVREDQGYDRSSRPVSYSNEMQVPGMYTLGSALCCICSLKRSIRVIENQVSQGASSLKLHLL